MVCEVKFHSKRHSAKLFCRGVLPGYAIALNALLGSDGVDGLAAVEHQQGASSFQRALPTR